MDSFVLLFQKFKSMVLEQGLKCTPGNILSCKELARVLRTDFGAGLDKFVGNELGGSSGLFLDNKLFSKAREMCVERLPTHHMKAIGLCLHNQITHYLF
jgi:hypothetical protein